jgi:hypothetical protein
LLALRRLCALLWLPAGRRQLPRSRQLALRRSLRDGGERQSGDDDDGSDTVAHRASPWMDSMYGSFRHKCDGVAAWR